MDNGIDMRKLNGLFQKLADLRIDMAIYAVSKYDENTKFNMLVMCLNNIKTHIENNKDKKAEILNILQLFRSNEVFKMLEGFQRKSNTSTAGGGSGSRSGSGSSERKRKGSRSSKRSTSPSANAPSPKEQQEVLENGMRTISKLKSPSNTPRSNDDSTTQLVASAVAYQQAVHDNQMEQKKFAATMMGNTSDAAKQLVNSAEIRVKNAHENLSKLIDKLNDEEKKILERVKVEYDKQVKEMEAKYEGKVLELKQRQFTEHVAMAVGTIPGGLAGHSFGGAITAGLVGLTAMAGNMAYNLQNVLSWPFYGSPCIDDPYHPIAVPTSESNCTPGRYWGETCTTKGSYRCESAPGMTFGTEHFALIAGVTGALLSGLSVWMGSRFVRGQSKLSEMPSGVVGTITSPIQVAWKFSGLGTLIQSIQSSEERGKLQRDALAGPGAWREEHKLVDSMIMIDKAMKTWSEGMQKHYLANIKHAEEQLKVANEGLQKANQLADSVVEKTLQASTQILLQDSTPHPLPSYPKMQQLEDRKGGKRINKTRRKRKTCQNRKTHQKRNIRQNRKTRR